MALNEWLESDMSRFASLLQLFAVVDSYSRDVNVSCIQGFALFCPIVTLLVMSLEIFLLS